MWDPEAPSRSVPLRAWLVQPRAREPVCPGFRLLPPPGPAPTVPCGRCREGAVGRKRAPSRDGEFFGLGIKGVDPPQKAA